MASVILQIKPAFVELWPLKAESWVRLSRELDPDPWKNELDSKHFKHMNNSWAAERGLRLYKTFSTYRGAVYNDNNCKLLGDKDFIGNDVLSNNLNYMYFLKR